LSDGDDTNFGGRAIALVSNLKNVGRKAQPVNTILMTPIAIGFWQQVDKASNQMIDCVCVSSLTVRMIIGISVSC
jgi:hypothetical protein